MGIRGWRTVALASALALSSVATTLAPATAGPTPRLSTADYPTWDQVEAARGNEAATTATVTAIQSLLGSLQADAARLGDAAIARAADADRAARDLRSASDIAASLSQRSDAAAAAAQESARHAAAVVAALYRSGGDTVTPTLITSSGSESADLLYRLGALSKLSDQLDLALEKARADHNQAQALSDQAAVARAERTRLASAAQSAATEAASAAAAADAAVAAQQSNLNVLYAQLAVLKNTTVALEQQYQVGQQASNGSGGDGSGGGSGGGSVDVPTGAVNDPQSAQAFAFSILAQNGFGSDQNSCLLWLWNRESGWRTNAYNASSGAYGIPQSLPGSKMASVGADWRTSYQTQVTWGLLYIFGRYDTPCGAWAHSESVGWY